MHCVSGGFPGSHRCEPRAPTPGDRMGARREGTRGRRGGGHEEGSDEEDGVDDAVVLGVVGHLRELPPDHLSARRPRQGHAKKRI